MVVAMGIRSLDQVRLPDGDLAALIAADPDVDGLKMVEAMPLASVIAESVVNEPADAGVTVKCTHSPACPKPPV